MLTAGTKIGPYEILALIGAGGMGEVYRARDTKLNRDVALKILPEAVANDPERFARFTREAQTLASLNHPHIAHIYGLEGPSSQTGPTATGQEALRALVMELAEGEDLSEKLKVRSEKGEGQQKKIEGLPLDEALPIARQIAEALEAAHEQGIVHRDLKPANIKVTPDGNVKILDFGLAKAIGPADAGPGSPSLSMSPTLSLHATYAGVILGTASYMSPEQARGKPVDRRTDIWAFGCVFYEMLTGRRTFDGEDVSVIAAAVIKEEPRWDDVPPEVLRLIKKCLQKDPKQRLRDIGDVWELLEDRPAPASPVQRTVPPASSRLGVVAWAVAALALTALVGLSFVHFREQPLVAEPVRFQIPPPEGAAINSVSVSPDGRQVAFTARGADGRSLLGVRSLETLESRLLPGAEANSNGPGLFWSPDSRFIGFAFQGKLKRIEVAGGSAQTLCDFAGRFFGGAWSRDGVIIFGTNNSHGLLQVSETGGQTSPITDLGRVNVQEFHGNPAFLPDGRHFLYQQFSNAPEKRGIYAGSLDRKPEQQGSNRLLTTESPAVYASSTNGRMGYLLFGREGSIMAQAINAARLEVTGAAVRVADVPGSATAPYSASSTGVLAYAPLAGGGSNNRLVWYNRQGKSLGQLGPSGTYAGVSLSPDGKKIVVGVTDAVGGTGHLSTAETDRGVFGRLNPGDTFDTAATVSPDGRVIFSFAFNGALGDIYATPLQGGGTPELLVKSDIQLHPNNVSQDGRYLVYDAHNGAQRQDLMILPLGGDRKPIPFLATSADETFGQFSPDGKWIAYSSDESGHRDVYVRGFAPDHVPAAAVGKWRISTAGGDKPRWQHEGKELYYIAPDGKMMAVPVKTGATFEPGLAVPLFDTHVTSFVPYDVSPDGRFLLNDVNEGTASSSPITVVLNWQGGLPK